MWPWTTKPVLSHWVIFVAIAKNTLYGSILCTYPGIYLYRYGYCIMAACQAEHRHSFDLNDLVLSVRLLLFSVFPSVLIWNFLHLFSLILCYRRDNNHRWKMPFWPAVWGQSQKAEFCTLGVFQDMTFMSTFLCDEWLISESAIHCSPLKERLKCFIFSSHHDVTAHCLSPHNIITLTGWIKRCFLLQQAADILNTQRSVKQHEMLKP